MAKDHLPKFKPGQAVTFTSSTAASAGNVAEVTGNRQVGVAGAASVKAIGTYAHNVAVGDLVVIHLPGLVDTAVAAAAIAAGDEVEAAASGKVQKRTTGRSLGIALTAATAANQSVEIVRA